MDLEHIKLPPGDKETTVELGPDECCGCFLPPTPKINKTLALSGPTEVVFLSSLVEFENRAIQ